MRLPTDICYPSTSSRAAIKTHALRILLWIVCLACLQLLTEPARTNLVVEYAPAVAQLSGKVVQESFVNKGIKVQKLILKLDSPVNVVSDGTVKDFPNVPKANVAEVEISDATSESLLTALKKSIGKNATLKGVLTHQLSNWQSREIIFEPTQIVGGSDSLRQSSQNNQPRDAGSSPAKSFAQIGDSMEEVFRKLGSSYSALGAKEGGVLHRAAGGSPALRATIDGVKHTVVFYRGKVAYIAYERPNGTLTGSEVSAFLLVNNVTRRQGNYDQWLSSDGSVSARCGADNFFLQIITKDYGSRWDRVGE